MFGSFLHFFPSARYESSDMLDNYIRAQYGPYLQDNPTDMFEEFYATIVAFARVYIDAGTNALDIGCGTGRLSFEYARLGANTSCGTETSSAFLDFCEQLSDGAVTKITFPLPDRLPTFVRDDVCASSLRDESCNFVSCLNVIDRVPDPFAAVSTIWRLLTPGGIALIADPYDWERSPAPKDLHVATMQELLPSEKWALLSEAHVLYRIPTGKTSYRDYDCHVVIVKKKL